jgi:hypothetical protein
MLITNTVRPLSILLIAFLLTACVEFEQQILTYSVVDDELIIFQEYRGIFGEQPKPSNENKKPKKKTELTEAEKREIDSVVYGERTFFFGNWIMEYNRAHLLKEATRLKYPKEELTDHQQQLRRIWLPLVDLLLANVTVSNGDFYYDEQQRLSGYQIVRARNLKQLITQANHSISQEILAEKAEPQQDKEQLELMEERKALAESGHQWIRVDKNRIAVSFPATQDEFAGMQKDIATFSNKGIPAMELSYSRGLATLVVGEATVEPIVISKEVFGPYTTNAVGYVASKYTIKEKEDIPRIKQAIFK